MSIISTRLDADTRDRFRAMAQALGRRESELLRELIQARLETQDSIDENLILTKVDGNQNVMVRIPKALMAALKGRAKTKGMAHSRWVADLVQSHLLQKPVFTMYESEQLRRATSELGAVGRNLNQIAHSLNINPNETDRVKIEMIDKLRLAIKKEMHSTRLLINASNRSWHLLEK